MSRAAVPCAQDGMGHYGFHTVHGSEVFLEVWLMKQLAPQSTNVAQTPMDPQPMIASDSRVWDSRVLGWCTLCNVPALHQMHLQTRCKRQADNRWILFDP
jgi:hypothetical protein